MKDLVLDPSLVPYIIEAADYYRSEYSQHRNGTGHATAAIKGVDYLLGLAMLHQGYTRPQIATALGRKETTLIEALTCAQQRLATYKKLKDLGRL